MSLELAKSDNEIGTVLYNRANWKVTEMEREIKHSGFVEDAKDKIILIEKDIELSKKHYPLFGDSYAVLERLNKLKQWLLS